MNIRPFPVNQKPVNQTPFNQPPIKQRPGKQHATCLLLALITGLTLLSGCASSPPVQAPADQHSRSQTTPPGEISEPNYQQLIADVKRQHGPVAAARVSYWADIIENGKHQADLEKLQHTNRFFNQARFLSDQEIWQQHDYWATPVEFLIKDAGDCEDFSIAKYLTLDLMGLDTDKMRITYVTADSLDQPHMVLAYYAQPTDTPLILDNITPLILPADQREDLTPVYSFNGRTLWLARSRNDQVETGDSQQIKLWRELKYKIERELGAPIN